MIPSHDHIVTVIMQTIIDHLDETEHGRVNVAEAIRICAALAASFVSIFEGDEKERAAQHTVRETITALALAGVALQGNLTVVAVAPSKKDQTP